MTTSFATWNALTDHIMDAILGGVAGSEFGTSSRSISRYVEKDEKRVRISDHDATASCGGGVVYEIDVRKFNFHEIKDEFGEFDHIESEHGWMIEEATARAVAALS